MKVGETKRSIHRERAMCVSQEDGATSKDESTLLAVVCRDCCGLCACLGFGYSHDFIA